MADFLVAPLQVPVCLQKTHLFPSGRLAPSVLTIFPLMVTSQHHFIVAIDLCGVDQ